MSTTDAIITKIVENLTEGQVEFRTLRGTDGFGTDWTAIVVQSPERHADTLRVWTNDNVLHLARADRYGTPTGADDIAMTNPTATVALAVFGQLFLTHLA